MKRWLALALAACGPSAGDYPLLRPDATVPDEPIDPGPAAPENIIEDEPLEAWDTTGAGALSGIFAVELRGRATAIVEVEFRELYRMRLLQQGEDVRVRLQMCRFALPSIEGLAELSVPLALEQLIRAQASEAEGPYLGDDGASFTPPEYELSFEADGDQDGDGEPGVTVLAETILCDAPESAFVALHALNGLDGTVDSVDHLAGAATPTLDLAVLGYSDPCLAAAADLDIQVLPGSSFEATRAGDERDLDRNGNVVCGEIVAAAPELFGPFWLD